MSPSAAASRLEGLKFEWGQPVDPVALRKELATGQYDGR